MNMLVFAVIINIPMLQIIQLSLDSLLVSAIMSRNVKTVVEGRDMRAGCRVMSDNDIGSVVIVKTRRTMNKFQ